VALTSRLYRDVGGGPEDCMLLAGMARSGTTWLAETICSQLECRLIFEPFHPDLVPPYSGLEYQQYLRPHEESTRFQSFFEPLASGRMRNRWIDREVAYLRPGCRLIKAVRGSLVLGWIHARYPTLPLLLVVRHPCANVASFLRLGWSSDRDIESILAQRALVEDHVAEHMGTLERATHPHQRIAVLWCVVNLVPLRQLGREGLHRFYYEDLRDRPYETVPRVFEALRRPFDESVYGELDRASRTAKRPSDFGRRAQSTQRWRTELGDSRVDDVLEIVAAFGLDHLYHADGTPTGRWEADD
jgi:hypothetical protein